MSDKKYLVLEQHKFNKSMMFGVLNSMQTYDEDKAFEKLVALRNFKRGQIKIFIIIMLIVNIFGS